MATSHPKDKLRRVIFFPLLLFYCLVLFVAAWPRVLTPGKHIPTIQVAAHFLLFQLGWPTGQSLFSGQATPTHATRMNCHRIEAIDPKGARHVVYDSLWRCENNDTAFLKDPIDQFYEKHLTRAFHLLQGKPAEMDRNSFPLNILFAISDYHCQQHPNATKVVYTRIEKNARYSDGMPLTSTATEGAHHCALGAWESD